MIIKLKNCVHVNSTASLKIDLSLTSVYSFQILNIRKNSDAPPHPFIHRISIPRPVFSDPRVNKILKKLRSPRLF